MRVSHKLHDIYNANSSRDIGEVYDSIQKYDRVFVLPGFGFHSGNTMLQFVKGFNDFMNGESY